MKNIIQTGAVCAAVMLGAIASSALALTMEQIKQRDFDGDGMIESGPELNALQDVRKELSTYQEAVLLENVQVQGKSAIPVAAFDDESYYRRLKERCEVQKRFFLQDSISSISLLDTALISRSKEGARFTLTHNRKDDTTSWEAEGAISWLPNTFKKCLRVGETAAPSSAVLTGYAFAPVLSFNGEGSSGTSDTSSLRFGIMSQFQIFGGNTFSLQEVIVTPYYQTDFEGRAEIYGLEASWRPYQFKSLEIGSTLNGISKGKANQPWDVSFVAKADIQTVEKAGLSGLTDGEDYGWLGLNLGIGYTVPLGQHGTRFNLGVDAFHDVLNDESATLFSASATMFLSEDKRTSLQFLYENGEDYQDLTDKDALTLNLRLAF